MRRFLLNLPLLALAAALVGCGKCCSTSSGDAAKATAAAPAVEWPALKAFDLAAEKAEGLAEKKDAAGARAALAEIAAATQALVASAVPNNAHNPLTVKELLADAKELADALGKGAALADDAVITLVGSVHPLAEKLMAEGRSNTAIAQALVVSDGAIEKHVSNIFSKLGLTPAETDHRRVLAVLRYLEGTAS